jgi:2TM domain
MRKECPGAQRVRRPARAASAPSACVRAWWLQSPAPEVVMTQTNRDNDNEIWERQQRREGWNDLVTHAHVFAFVNFGLFFVWSRSGGYPWFVWPLLFSSYLLIAHAVSLWLAPYTRRERAAVRRYLIELRRSTASRSGSAGVAGSEAEAGVDRDRAGAAR